MSEIVSRPTNEKYRKEFDRIFGNKEKKGPGPGPFSCNGCSIKGCSIACNTDDGIIEGCPMTPHNEGVDTNA